MNKSITLSKDDWYTVIEGLDCAAEMAKEVVKLHECSDAQAEVNAYYALIDLIHKELVNK
jgi:hypothetical protein